MTANTATVDIFTPSPRNDQFVLHEQLLTSMSLNDSTEGLPTPSEQKIRQRNNVKFADPKLLRKPGATERIKVDEVDDLSPIPDERPTRSARRRSRSVLRNAAGPRSASRPGRCRTLSRGMPISRDTTCNQQDSPALTAEQVARELRPESFTRFKRISVSTNTQMSTIDYVEASSTVECREDTFENEAKAIREKLEQIYSPSSLSPGADADTAASDDDHSKQS